MTKKKNAGYRGICMYIW